MKFSTVLVAWASLATPLVRAMAVPNALSVDALSAMLHARPFSARDESPSAPERLFRRKGGGGKSSSSSSSSGSSKGSSSSSTSSNTGGRTTTGSGVKPAYGGGAYYSGGSTTPYRSGSVSPSGIAPLAIGAGVALAFWPGLWYHPIYYYPYARPYTFYNRTSNQTETKSVGCGCDESVECGCDDNSNSTYFDDLLGNGSVSALNSSVVTIADVNGTSTILVNGTLANGTTASGGTESAAAGLLKAGGWWPAAGTVLAMTFLL